MLAKLLGKLQMSALYQIHINFCWCRLNSLGYQVDPGPRGVNQLAAVDGFALAVEIQPD